MSCARSSRWGCIRRSFPLDSPRWLGNDGVARVAAIARRKQSAETTGCRSDAGQAHSRRGGPKKALKPAQRRQLAGWIQQRYRPSVSRACLLAQFSRAAWYRRSTAADQSALIRRIRSRMARGHPANLAGAEKARCESLRRRHVARWAIDQPIRIWPKGRIRRKAPRGPGSQPEEQSKATDRKSGIPRKDQERQARDRWE